MKEQIFFDFTRKRKTNVTGKLTLRSLSDLTLGQIGDIGKFCFNKEDGNADLATTVMTNKIDTHFKHGYNLQVDIPLDKFRVDWDIKNFLKTHGGVILWDDWNEESKKSCFK